MLLLLPLNSHHCACAYTPGGKQPRVIVHPGSGGSWQPILQRHTRLGATSSAGCKHHPGCFMSARQGARAEVGQAAPYRAPKPTTRLGCRHGPLPSRRPPPPSACRWFGFPRVHILCSHVAACVASHHPKPPHPQQHPSKPTRICRLH